jgi:hypothetical protein
MSSSLFEAYFSRIGSRLWSRLKYVEGVKACRTFKRISTRPLPARTGVMAVKKFVFPPPISDTATEA